MMMMVIYTHKKEDRKKNCPKKALLYMQSTQLSSGFFCKVIFDILKLTQGNFVFKNVLHLIVLALTLSSLSYQSNPQLIVKKHFTREENIEKFLSVELF